MDLARLQKNIAKILPAVFLQWIVMQKEVWKKYLFSTSVSLHLGNSASHGHIYSGRRIGTRMRSIQ